MAAAKAEDSSGKSLREIVQKKFLEEVIGFGGNWKALVMDKASTKIMSSACTMFDIMEKRVTIVENLNNKRQPFPEMDVVYFITPSEASIRLMVADFENAKKPMYGAVHVIFTDTLSNECMSMVQAAGNFVARIKTFKEINVDFHVVESTLYSLDMPESLTKVYGSVADLSIATVIGKRLANVCISLNEQPTIRFQGSSPIASQIAKTMNDTIIAYKRANATFWCYGDDSTKERERGTMVILDRSFDLASPLMHEYTYQAMVYDLLPVENNLLKYKSDTGKGTIEKEALLGEQDEVWVELRNSHIVKVIAVISEKMKDILQNSSGAKLSKKGDKEISVSDMAAAVKALPEYQQTMSRWGAHTSISGLCMSAFTNPKENVFELSNIEQMVSTGTYFDPEEGLQTLKPADIFTKMVQHMETMTNKAAKLRLVCIWWICQKTASEDQKKQVIQAAGITGSDQQILLNFGKMSTNSTSLAAVQQASSTAKSGGVFSSLFGGGDKKKDSSAGGGGGDADYVSSRHTPQIKTILEQLQSGELPVAQFPTAGPASAAKDANKGKSVRKFGNNNRWGTKADAGFDGGRVMVFIAGGIGYSEIRAAHEVSTAQRKEVIVGSTNIINPSGYIDVVTNLSAAPASAALPRP